MMSIVFELPWTLIVAWGVVVVWAVAQVVSFKRLRVEPAPLPAPRRESSRQRSAKLPTPALPIGGTPEFLSELGLHDPNAARSEESVYR